MRSRSPGSDEWQSEIRFLLAAIDIRAYAGGPLKYVLRQETRPIPESVQLQLLLSLLLDLVEEFKNVNLEEELIRFRLWLSECPPHPKLRYRLFLRKWIQNAASRKII